MLTAQFGVERQRRRRLLESKGDIELSIRELFGVKMEPGEDGGHGLDALGELDPEMADGLGVLDGALIVSTARRRRLHIHIC